MTIGLRRAAVVAAGAALAVLVTGCGDQRAGTSPGTAPEPAVSAALGSVVADHCPARQPARPASDVAGLERSLEPLKADRLLLCGYGGRTGTARPGALNGHALVTDPAVVERLRTGLDGLGPVPKGTYNCPDDTGATVLAVFTDGVHEVQLTDRTTGCSTVTNGVLTRWVGGSAVNATVRGLLRRP
jgi:hypothetical protein